MGKTYLRSKDSKESIASLKRVIDTYGSTSVIGKAYSVTLEKLKKQLNGKSTET